MNTTKDHVKAILNKLPNNCSLEDVQYHLYVADKIQKGINRAENEGTFNQQEIEEKLSQWRNQ